MNFLKKLFYKKHSPRYIYIGLVVGKNDGEYLNNWVVDINHLLAEKQLTRLFENEFGNTNIMRIEVYRMDLRYYSKYNFEIVNDFIEATENGDL